MKFIQPQQSLMFRDTQNHMLVDVGGNTGYESASFKAANPHIKGRAIVQDLAETLNSSVAPKGVERQVYDCFTPQPIKGMSTKTHSSDPFLSH